MSRLTRLNPRRRESVQVEPLEGRILQSGLRAAIPRTQTQLEVTPATPNITQGQGSFTATLSLQTVTLNGRKPSTPATLSAPLTVDFTATAALPNSSTPTGTSAAVFAPYHQSVTFPAGVSTETVTVPILSTATTASPATISLSAWSDASRSQGITDVPGAATLYTSVDAIPPQITGVETATQGKLATAVIVHFSKPMAPETAGDPASYRIVSRPQVTSSPGFFFKKGTATRTIHAFPIASANYDASTDSVTLTLKRPTRAAGLDQVVNAFPIQGHLLTDTRGQTLVPAPGSDASQGNGVFAVLVNPSARETARTVGRLSISYKTSSSLSNLSPLPKL